MRPKLKGTIVLMIALCLVWATGANAQLTVFNSNVPPGFSVFGIIQAATLNTALQPGTLNGIDAAGGTLTINGVTMIVPDNSVVQMPANTLKWSELFDPSVATKPVYDKIIGTPPVNLTIPSLTSGLALLDNPLQTLGTSPWLPFNAIVQGNIDVKNATGKGAGAYIVGLILPINQDLGNLGQGFITFIDYAKGRFEVGGTLGVQNTGTVVELNDPVGRHGLAHSPDPRFSVDTENPTVASGNGYPMCIPRFDPAVKVDPDCPSYNRPLNPAIGATGHDPFLQPGAPLMAFFMPAKAAPNATGVTTPDPWKQAPFMLGDYVNFSGVMYKINPLAALVPFNPAVAVGPTNLPLNQQVYYSANTVSSDKLAIYTAAGTAATIGTAGPAYVQLFAGRIGTGGTSLIVPATPSLGILGGVDPVVEPRRNIFIRGWCTDSTQFVDLYAVDVSPTGVETERLLGTVLPEPGFAAGKGNKGRFRLEIGKGNFLPATRNFRAKTRHGQVQLGLQAGINGGTLTGLKTGQYSAPDFIFQFTDAPPGFPVIPNNFNTIPFLTLGEGTNPSDGPLNPFPPFTP